MQNDKRVLKTKTSIKRAFMELAEDKEISKITISELSERALVNRSTFYLHYSDVADVAADIDEEISERICSCIDDYDITDIYGSNYSLFRKLTNRLEGNALMKRYIISSTISDAVIARMKEVFVDKAIRTIMRKFPHISEKRLTYPLTYAAAGIVDSYVKWVRQDKPAITLEELIRDTSFITEHIISKITET